MQRVKTFQRSSEAHKQAWYAFCVQQGTSNYDPARHDLGALQHFLNAVESGELVVDDASSYNGWEGGADFQDLVRQVKEFQRKSEGHKQAWYRFCGQQGTSNYDPSRHDVGALQQFVTSVRNGEISVDPKASQPTHWPSSGKGKGEVHWGTGKNTWKGGGSWAGHSWSDACSSWGDSSAGCDTSWNGDWTSMMQMMQMMMSMKGMTGKGDMASALASAAAMVGGFGKGKGCGCGCGCSCGQWSESSSADANGGRPGDWICPNCSNVNFSSRDKCNKCGSGGRGPERLGMKKGDWICPSCGDLVFASKSNCKMCGSAKPEALEESRSYGAAPSKGSHRYDPYVM